MFTASETDGHDDISPKRSRTRDKQVHMFTSTINDSDMGQLRGFKKAGGTVSKMTQRHAFFGWDPMTPRAVGRLEVAANGGAFANCTGIV